ncbi:MAG: DUF1573 domain-containing protein [Chloroflexi bacterium]|nr:DUF1573 domain-containing protein [Chloroflexota bacterium]
MKLYAIIQRQTPEPATRASDPGQQSLRLLWALTLASLLLLLTQFGLVTWPYDPQGFPGDYVVRPDVEGATPVQSAAVRPSVPDGASNATSASAPGLKVDRERIDLGDVKLNQVVGVAFTLTNAGGQPLRIQEPPYIEVLEGCCPPDPVVGAMTLNPGQSTQLSLQFMMHEGMGGKHLFRVHVKSDDPNQPDRTLDVVSNWV